MSTAPITESKTSFLAIRPLTYGYYQVLITVSISDIIENLKDAVNPKRREKVTPPNYDPETRGAYADEPPSASGQTGLSPLTSTDIPAVE